MLLLIGFCVALLSGTDAFSYKEANRYIDSVLDNHFQAEITYARLDPLKLNNLTANFSSRLFYDNYAVLYNGTLSGLSGVIRNNNCTIPHWSSANITFTCFIGFKNFHINYTANVFHENTEMTFYPSVVVKGTNATLQISSTLENNIPDLRLFFVNRIGDFTVSLPMISIGDTAERISPRLRNILEGNATNILYSTLYGQFRQALSYSVYKTPISFFDLK